LSNAFDEEEDYEDSDDETAKVTKDDVVVPEWMDKMWKVKTELVDNGNVQNLTQQTFCKHFGLQNRECFKVELHGDSGHH
jgi:hypothetical protein